MIVDGYHRSQILDGLDLDTTVDMTVDFSYDENIFSEDNDFSAISIYNQRGGT